MNTDEVRALVERQARAWERAGSRRRFCPDGVLISPGGRWQGHEALRRAAESFFAASGDVAVQVTRVLCNGDQGTAEWSWSETSRADGRRHVAQDAVVFELRDGKIVYWREYFDRARRAGSPSRSGAPREEVTAMLVEHRGLYPTIDPTAWVAPNAVISGAVTIGPRTRVLYGAGPVVPSGPIATTECWRGMFETAREDEMRGVTITAFDGVRWVVLMTFRAELGV